MSIAEDLAQHLDARIVTLLRDFTSCCAVIGVPDDDAAVLVVKVLGHHAATAAANGLQATEIEYLDACRWQYERMPSYARTEDDDQSRWRSDAE
jgi:hypothetical protein